MSAINETLSTVDQVSSTYRLAAGQTATWSFTTAGLTGYAVIERGEHPWALGALRTINANETNQFEGPGYFRFRLVKKTGGESCTISIADNNVQAAPSDLTALTTRVAAIEASITESRFAGGADNTGTLPCDAAFAAALASGACVIRIPAGIYRFNNTITINRSVRIIGDGRNYTFLRSYVTGNNHGMRIIGETSLGRSNVVELLGLDLEYKGTGQTASSNWCGVFIQRKIYMRDCYVHGFTNDGGMMAPSNADVANSLKGTISNAPFFCYMENCWWKDNGRNGFWMRMGANANMFINNQFDRNGARGLRHFNDSPDDGAQTASTYGTIIIGGQASYNKLEGWYFENGTNICMFWTYAEYNCSTDNTDTNGYTNGAAADPLIDFYFGDNVSNSFFVIGVLFQASTTHIRMPASSNTTTQVWAGGRPLSNHIPTLGAVSTSSPAAGGAGALPATPLGYIEIKVAGTMRKVAYYA